MNKPETLQLFEASAPGTVPMTGADWIALARLVLEIDGSAAARAVLQMSPLPKPPSVPVVEAMFVRECIDFQHGAQVQASDMHHLYSAWCGAHGFKPLDPRGFGRAMTRLGFERHKRSFLFYKDVRIRRSEKEALK